MVAAGIVCDKGSIGCTFLPDCDARSEQFDLSPPGNLGRAGALSWLFVEFMRECKRFEISTIWILSTRGGQRPVKADRVEIETTILIAAGQLGLAAKVAGKPTIQSQLGVERGKPGWAQVMSLSLVSSQPNERRRTQTAVALAALSDAAK